MTFSHYPQTIERIKIIERAQTAIKAVTGLPLRKDGTCVVGYRHRC